MDKGDSSGNNERAARPAGGAQAGDTDQPRSNSQAAEAKTGTQSGSNPEPALSNSGLDTQGRFRVGEKISLGVRGGDIVLQQAGSGREVVVSETDLQGYLLDQFFTDRVKAGTDA